MFMNKTLITFFTFLFCLTSSVGWGEKSTDLVKRNGVFYKKFSNLPFTGKVFGIQNDIYIYILPTYFNLNKCKKCLIKGKFINGILNDEWLVFHPNGQLKFQGKFNNGKPNGLFLMYNDQGIQKKSGNFINGKKEGLFVIVSLITNKLLLKANFKNDKRNGDVKQYYRTGELEEEGKYKNDILIRGFRIFYNQYNNNSKIKYFKDGKIIKEDIKELKCRVKKKDIYDTCKTFFTPKIDYSILN